MTTLLQDLRYSFRQIRRSPGFFAAAVLLIALGVAANTLIFTLVEAVLLRPLPVRDPQNLVQLFELRPRLPAYPVFDYGLLRQIAAQSSTVTDVIGQLEDVEPLERGGVIERIHSQRVTDDFFRLLGVPATLGRVLGDGDDNVAVLSYGYWARSFGSDPGALGQTIRIQGHAFRIVGVASARFVGTTVDSGPDLWVPMRSTRYFSADPNRPANPNFDMNEASMEILARLRPGIELARAQAEVSALWSRYNQQNMPRDAQQRQVEAESRMENRSIARVRSPLRDQSSSALALLMAGTGLLLLMVSANVGGLLLARASAREKETAVRLAIGASRWQIARLCFTESLILAAAGGVLGTLAAYATLPLLMGWLPPARGIGLDLTEIRVRALELHPNWKVAAFGADVCALAAVLPAIVPAWRSSRRDLWTALKITAGDAALRRFESALCGVQIALCTLLLVFAGLVTRTLSNLRNADKGIDPAHIAIFSIDPVIARYTSAQAFTLRKRLLEGAQALPGVDAAAIANYPLMRGIGWGGWAIFPDRPPEGALNTSRNMVTRVYFETLGIRVVSGRSFNSTDSLARKPAPVVVNQAFVRKFYPGRNPLGQVFAQGRRWVAPEFEIIGVVNDTKYRSMREVPPPIYYSEGPGPDEFPGSFVLHVRAHGDPRALIPSIRQLLASIDPRLPLYEVATLTEEIDRSLWQERLLVALASCFGAFAVMLSAIGLYGILAYFVASRRREIGLRMALGAEPVHVGRLLARQLMPTLIVGLAGGAALSLAAGTWVRGVLYDVSGFDARSIVTALVTVLAVAIASAASPALRAVRVDPASTLRQE